VHATRWAGGARTTLAACTGAYFAVRVGQIVVSPALPEITGALDVSTAAAGGALTAMWAAYAVMQLPSGVLVGRVGERRTVLASLAVVALSSVLVAVAPSYLGFFLALAVLGAGAGLYYNAAAALLAARLSGVGTALGVHKLGSRGAGLVAPVLATAVLVPFGWRAVPLTAVGVALVGAVVVVAFVDATPPTRPASGTAIEDAVAPLADPVVARTTVLTAAGEFVEQAAMSFLPTALVAYHGLGVAAAGGLFSAFFAASAVAGTAMGWLSDRTTPALSTLVTVLAGVVGFGLLAWAGATGGLLLAGVALVGVATGWTAPLQSRVLDALPDRGRGPGFGAFRTVYVLVGSLGSVVVGTLATVAGWPTALGFLGALLGGMGLWLVGEQLLA
jgi:predicted MFS family arabinose efflux permease